MCVCNKTCPQRSVNELYFSGHSSGSRRNAPIISHYFFRQLMHSWARESGGCQLALSLAESLFKARPLPGMVYIHLRHSLACATALPDVGQGAVELVCGVRSSCSSNKVHFVVEHDTSKCNKSISHCSRNEEQTAAVQFTCYSASLPLVCLLLVANFF